MPEAEKPLEILYSRLSRDPVSVRDSWYQLKQLTLPLLYWGAAHCLGTPGLAFQRLVMQRALKLRLAGAHRCAGYHEMVTLPLDSVRYFEFDFMWRSVGTLAAPGSYLDISSPRMFPLLLLQNNPRLRGDLVNPDLRDLEVTRALFDNCGLSGRCGFRGALAGELDLAPESYDIVTSISVLEHIPGRGDRAAVEVMWRLLKPGGRLLLSVPCAARAFEEHIDYDEYRLQAAGGKAFVFGQRFYHDALLQERIFTVTGPPARMGVYGEKRPGFSIENRNAKNSDPNYPCWREPYLMGKEFAHFAAIDQLPGWGVVAMEFRK